MANLNTIIGAKDNSSSIFSKLHSNIQKTISLNGKMNSASVGSTSGIDKMRSAQQSTNSSIQQGTNNANGLKNVFSSIPGKIVAINQGLQLLRAGLDAVKGSMENVDTFITTQARLELMNDGLQTTAQLTDKLYSAANRSRASFDTMSQVVGKLGMTASNAFTSNDQMLKFAETANKMAQLSGSSASETSNAMYQLTQALASGRLQGDEFRSIIENMPMYANALSESLGVTRGELRAMATDSKLTSDVMVKAMMEASETVDSKFATFPMTFQGIGNKISNDFSRSMMDVKASISEALNSEGLRLFINYFITGMTVLVSMLAPIIGFIISLFATIGNAINWIAGIVMSNLPIFIGLLVGIGIILASILVPWMFSLIATLAYAAISFVLMGVAGFWAWITAISPVVLVLAALAAIIGAIVWVTGSFENAGRIIGGILGGIAAFAYNSVVVPIYNGFATLGNFLANLFIDPVYSIKRLLADLVSEFLDKVRIITDISDDLFGTKFGNTFDEINAGMDSWVGPAPEGANPIEKLQEMNYSDAISFGADVGGSLGAGVDGLIGSIGSGIADLMSGPGGNPMDNTQLAGAGDYASVNIPVDGSGKVKVNASGSDVNISDEDLKYLKDVASREFMLNYKKVEPTFSISVGDVHENADTGKVMAAIEQMVSEQYASMYTEELS